MMLPRTKKEEKLAEKTTDKKDDVLYNMQEQMLYLAPIMTVLFGWQLPSGLVLYWLLTTLVSLAQQWYFERRS
jgi:YidC/Oxa1 family membrane protein insertase